MIKGTWSIKMTAGTKDIKLKRQLGLIHGVGVILGLVIGSGIYISPKGVIIGAGSPGLALIIWLVCGIAGKVVLVIICNHGIWYI